MKKKDKRVWYHHVDTIVTNDQNVISAWREGTKARNHATTCYTDGRFLWSNGVNIGVRKNNICMLKDATAGGGEYFSHETSRHVNIARDFADVVFHSKVWDKTPAIGWVPHIPF
jgi:hypothetical protein